jgi:hypothetical protein
MKSGHGGRGSFQLRYLFNANNNKGLSNAFTQVPRLKLTCIKQCKLMQGIQSLDSNVGVPSNL